MLMYAFLMINKINPKGIIVESNPTVKGNYKNQRLVGICFRVSMLLNIVYLENVCL